MEEGLLISPEDKVIRRWAGYQEFVNGKNIIPTGFARLCGDETTAKEQFRDGDGCTFRLTFLDCDNGEMERQYENCYLDFYRDAKEAKVEKHKKYFVQAGHNGKRVKWSWSLQS